MGMIRVSDQVETRLKEVADGRSMNSVIEKMLAYCSSPDGFCPAPQAGARDYEPYILEQMNKRFDELKSLIEDTTVDRVDGPIKSVSGTVRIYVPWDVARKLLYEFLPEDASEFIGSASEAIRQTDDEFPVYIQDDKLWTEDFYGAKSPILNITPRVTQFLKEANVAEH